VIGADRSVYGTDPRKKHGATLKRINYFNQRYLKYGDIEWLSRCTLQMYKVKDQEFSHIDAIIVFI